MKPSQSLPTLLISAGAVFAQSVVTPAAQNVPIELNPFIITETADQSYAPSETLSGTRLRSLVKDVPSAITMLSEDMLRDLGARDFNDVLDFLPSTMSYP
jgi:hypothetical protein